MAGKQTRLSTYCHLTAVAVLLMLQTAAISSAPLLERDVRQSAQNDANKKLVEIGYKITSDALRFTDTLPNETADPVSIHNIQNKNI